MMTDDEQIRMLAQVERDMDAGKLDYVQLNGKRVVVSAKAKEHFGLRTGQTINSNIFGALLEFNLADVQAAIALQNAGAKT